MSLSTKKKHWSKVQEKQSVFKDSVTASNDFNGHKQTTTANTDSPELATEHNAPSARVGTGLNAEQGKTEGKVEGNVECKVEIAGGFEREDVSRLIVNINNVVLSTGVVASFPLIINRRGNRTEVEFYEPKPNRSFPLSQFIASGNNGVTDYMLVMQEQMGSNAFYKLSSNDQADLITILTQLNIALLKEQFALKDNVNVGKTSNWCKAVEQLISGFTEAKTEESVSHFSQNEASIVVKNLALFSDTKQEDNVLVLCGNALVDEKSEPQRFTLSLRADSNVNAVTSVKLDDAALVSNKTQLLHAVGSSLHKTNLNGKVLSYSLERWYYALQKFSGEF